MINKHSRIITVYEFQKIYVDHASIVTQKDISELKNYIDEQNSYNYDMSDISQFLRPIKNGVQILNYVGVIQTKSGLTIEILPKLYKNMEDSSANQIRQLVLKMLKKIGKFDGKNFSNAHLALSKYNLLEVFISIFLNEVDRVIKKDMKFDYIRIQNNEKYLKGKLLLYPHMRKNSINKSNFFIQYDDFLIDCIENQIIKTTLEFLLYKSVSNKNISLIRKYLQYFENVNIVYEVDQNFQKINLGRSYVHYKTVLDWCKIFLSKRSFTFFKGNSLAFAILFPMEKLFEYYVTSLIRKILLTARVADQERKYTLFDKMNDTNSEYGLRPDVVIRYKEQIIIADLKWKLLSKKGPSQADLYQMYAYFTRYQQKMENISKVILLYPKSEEYLETSFVSKGQEDVTSYIEVKYIDLLSDTIEQDIENIFKY